MVVAVNVTALVVTRLNHDATKIPLSVFGNIVFARTTSVAAASSANTAIGTRKEPMNVMHNPLYSVVASDHL